jgi:hypothetical protein
MLKSFVFNFARCVGRILEHVLISMSTAFRDVNEYINIAAIITSIDLINCHHVTAIRTYHYNQSSRNSIDQIEVSVYICIIPGWKVSYILNGA